MGKYKSFFYFQVLSQLLWEIGSSTVYDRSTQKNIHNREFKSILQRMNLLHKCRLPTFFLKKVVVILLCVVDQNNCEKQTCYDNLSFFCITGLTIFAAMIY